MVDIMSILYTAPGLEFIVYLTDYVVYQLSPSGDFSHQAMLLTH